MEDGQEKQRKLKHTRRSRYIIHFGDILLVQLDWNLNRRAQDPTQPEVQRKPRRESSTHGGIVYVVCPVVGYRTLDNRREIDGRERSRREEMKTTKREKI
jgi:hypothetical protein